MTMKRKAGTPAAAKAWEWWSEFRASLRLYRKIAGHTQRTLGAALGQGQGNVATTEGGKYQTIRMNRLTRWLCAIRLELVFLGPGEEDILVGDWTTETAAAVGRIVTNLREAAGWTPDHLAALIDSSAPTVLEIERGKSDTRITTLAAIFIALGWTPEIRQKHAYPGTGPGDNQGDTQ